MSRYAVTRANIRSLAALLVLLSALGTATWLRASAVREARDWVEHTYEVIGTVRALEVAIRDAESGQRTFLLTGQAADLDLYEEGIGQVAFLQGELRRLTSDNAPTQARLRDLAPVLQRRLSSLAQGIQARRDSGFELAQRFVQNGAGRQLMAQVRAALGELMADETRLLAARLAAAERGAATLRWLVLAAALAAAAALGWAAWTLNRAWARSARTEAAQRALALRLRASLDSLSQGVGVFDAGHRLTNWNECFQVLLTLPRALAREGTPYGALVEATAEGGDASLLESEEQLRHGRAGRAGAGHVVFECARPDGHQLEIRRTPMPDGGFVLTITDMTQRARAEAVLREAQKMQAIGQLTGGIAHDFNNLLTVILGNLEFTRARLEDGHPAQARLERAVWAAQRGATLTGQLLAFARKQPLAPKPIDLSASMPDLVPLLRRTLGEHIDLRFVDAAGLWPAMADAAQLESAVLNLALNARDAMPGGGRLTIELSNKVLDEEYARAHAEVTAGDYVMLAVSDTGHGMTPEVARRIFEPFFTTKPDGRGTGLGLAMVWGFVRQSAGHVKVYSEPGEGTTVKVYLPRAVGAVAGVARPARGDPPADLPEGTATVLVVEDEPAVREISTEILRDLGYRVLEAADGEEGLRVFGAHAAEVDLLLTDVVLPGSLRGRELAERVTAVRPEVRVLYMSGYTENSIVHHGRLDDGVHLLGKPFKREQLARKVAEVLGAGRGGKVVPLRPRGSG